MTAHVCTPETCPTGHYYVTVVREGWSEVMPVLGPFVEHRDALAAVPHGRAIAEQVDSRCIWDAFGTVRTATDCGKGLLNNWGLEWRR